MGMLADSELQRQGYESFHPKVKDVKQWSRGRTRESERPYIPGYIFVRFDRMLDEWKQVQWSRGVKKLMMVDNVPTRITDVGMAMLLQRCTLTTDKYGVRHYYVDEASADQMLWAVGKTVRLTEGIWNGFVGPIAWADGQKLKVLLSIFGRQTEVALLKRDAEPVT